MSHTHENHPSADDVMASFDERAASWDTEENTSRARAIATTIAETVTCTPQTRLLEYGAGTGLVSQFLAPHVGSVTLVDVSEGMRAVAADKVASGVLPAGTRIWDLNLDEEEPPAEQVDLIVTVLALHHVGSLERTLAGFASLLAPGGQLAVVDLEAEDGSFHGGRTDVAHGFAEEALSGSMSAAGFAPTFHRGIYHIDKNDRQYPLFLAVGVR